MTVGLEVTECEIVVPGCPARWQRPSSRGRQRYSPTEMREAKEHVWCGFAGCVVGEDVIDDAFARY